MSGGVSTEDDATAVVGAAVSPAPGAVVAGGRVGRYLVIEELGRGGMGLVLRAYDPKLQREVALKHVRTRAMDDIAQVRLVREARAMARLSHPHVVAVYDVEIGEDGDGVVIVMEFVPGATLRQWLSAAARSWREILAVFVAAGQGLMAAHAEGLLHRDFKLDNVLVGADGRARVTDFGLARTTDSRVSSDAIESRDDDPATDGDDSLSGELTTTGMVMGTPRYMAPEQHDRGDLDARTDQYAFCVALWRALTGRWPFAQPGGALAQAKRAGAPAWPSDVSVPRHVVDAVRRGLAPRPADRWPTLATLLAELERDPTRGRRRWLAGGVVAIAALGVWGVQRVQRSRMLAACASEGERIAETWNEARASEIAAAFAATGIGYASDTWTRSRPRLDAYAQMWSQTRREVCERADLDGTMDLELAAASRACLDEHRDEVAALVDQLAAPDAAIVQKVGLATAALPPLPECTDALALQQRSALPEDPAVRSQVETLRARLARANAARQMGRRDEAMELAQAVLDEAIALGWPPLQAEARLSVSRVLDQLNRAEESVALAEQAFYEAGAAGRDELALEASIWLVYVVGHRLVREEDAARWARIAQMLVERQGHTDDLTGGGLHNNLGALHLARGAHADALASYEAAIAIRTKVLGPDHPEVAAAVDNAGIMHRYLHHDDEAIEAHRRARSIFEATLGPDHPIVATCLTNLGNAELQKGNPSEAVRMQEHALRIVENAFGPDDAQILPAIGNLALAAHHSGDLTRALALNERAFLIAQRTFGPEHPNMARLHLNIGGLHHDRGAHALARTHLDQALRIAEAKLGPDHATAAMIHGKLVEAYAAERAYPQAIEHGEKALAIEQSRTGAPASVAEAQFRLATVLWDSGSDRVRAVELASVAAEALRTSNPAALPAVEAWLRAKKH